jgi:hypothetical protein
LEVGDISLSFMSALLYILGPIIRAIIIIIMSEAVCIHVDSFIRNPLRRLIIY